MLSRIANSLFWMGRYIERSEHIMRFIEVQYMASLDAPKALEKKIALQSILNIVGVSEAYSKLYKEVEEGKVLHYTTLDRENDFSLISTITQARENARAVRDRLSSEAWEAINTFYHSTNNISASKEGKDQVPQLYQHVINNTYIIKGIIDNTLLRNEVWSFISLGIHLERAIQISRSVATKIKDIQLIDPSEREGPIDSYHWSNLLKSACGFDMSRRIYKVVPNKKHAIEFLVLNPKFPNSVVLNLEAVNHILDTVNNKKIIDKNSLEFFVGKLLSVIDFMNIDEVEGKEDAFINDIISKLYQIASMIETKYLTY
jgi:uncharacterized alpha-E superfamily protein